MWFNLLHLFLFMLISKPYFIGCSNESFGVPITLKIEELSVRSATIAWVLPEIFNTRMDECAVSYGVFNDSAITEKTIILPDEKKFVLNDLLPNSTYQLYFVCSSGGLLHASKALIFTTLSLFGNDSRSTAMNLTPISSSSTESSTGSSTNDVNDSTDHVQIDDIDSIAGIIFGLLAMLIIVTFCSVMLRNQRRGSNQGLLFGRQWLQPSDSAVVLPDDQ